LAIHLNDEQTSHVLELEKLHAWACELTTAMALGTGAEWSLSFVDESTIQGLNLDYRGIDDPTDVLSFPLMEGTPMPAVVPEGLQLLGDVVIAPAIAARQALERGHTLDDELALLMAHGLLHLLGYDHDTPENKDRMWDQQAFLLSRLGVVVHNFGDD
jgi:probable rRNA maturation factor